MKPKTNRAIQNGNPSLALKNLSLQINKKELIMTELLSKVNEINNRHQLAINSANEAIGYANQLGRLLTDIKVQLPHGSFTKWIEENLTVSPRQAQRYMAVASGKDLNVSKLGYKNDTVSVLTDEELMQNYDKPNWVPSIGYWHFCEFNNSAFWVVPYINDENFFFITQFTSADESHKSIDSECESFFYGSKEPTHYLSIDVSLHFYGMDYPEKNKWETYKKDGLSRPFGEPERLTVEFNKSLSR